MTTDPNVPMTEEEKIYLAERMADLRYGAKYRKKMRAQGMKERNFWSTPEQFQAIQDFLKELRNEEREAA